MSDHKPQEQEQSLPATPCGRWVFLPEEHFGQEEEQLKAALGNQPELDAAAAQKDMPTPASALDTPGKIKNRREQNAVRREDDEMKDRKLRRWGYALVLLTLAIVAGASAAFIVVAGLHKEFALAAPALAPLGASGALSARVWRKFSEGITPSEQMPAEEEPTTQEAGLPPDPTAEMA